MTTTLILLLYFADVAEKLSVLFGLSGGVLMFITVLCFFFGDVRKSQVAGRVQLLSITTVISTIFLLIACFLPSKQTLYGAAAIYVGAEVANSEELQLVRQLVVKELKKTMEAK